MPGVTVMRVALSAFSILFGSLGVLFVYLSFLVPFAGAHAVMSLGLAIAIVAATTPQR